MITWSPIAPNEVRVRGINWAPRLGTDTIVDSMWSDPGDLILSDRVYGSQDTFVTISNAVLDRTYAMTNTIVTASGQTEIETVTFVCALK